MFNFTIGVLALQGDVKEHCRAVSSLGARPLEIKYTEQLEVIDGLIIPGGESTTLDILSREKAVDMMSRIASLANDGLPLYGTCMGSILMAKRILGARPGQKSLNLMDITVERNAYGSQKASFEAELDICGFKQPLNAVFIRAPKIVESGPGVSVLATFDDSTVMARENNFLVTTFHPEITDDLRVHQLFLEMVETYSGLKVRELVRTGV